MGKLEKDLFHSIKQRLNLYQMTGECEWWGRLNSLKVKTIYGGIVQGLPKGTPDILALIRNRQEGLTALFLELKSDTGKLRKEQIEFRERYHRRAGFVFMEIREVKELDFWIEKNAKDFVCGITL